MIMPLHDEPEIRSTGGQIDEMTMALIDAAHDKNSNVREIISSSLVELGKKQPNMVLTTCHYYLAKHSKLPQSHRVVILSTMEKMINEVRDQIDQPLAVELVKQALDEMTRSKEVIPDWQTAASGVLVAIGRKYVNEVMEEILKKLLPGSLPHFFVVQTVGNLAIANVYGMIPFARPVLGTLLPMLGMAKQDNMRWVFSSALAKFSEAILDYIANIDNAPDPSVRKESFATEIYSAYEVLFNVWLKTNESKLRVIIVEAIGHMSQIMTLDKLQEQLPRLVSGIIGLYKKSEAFYVTQGLCMVLQAATAGGSMILEPLLENVLSNLFPQVCQPIDYSQTLTIKNHNELLRCFAVLTQSFSNRIVGFLINKLENNNEKIRIGALAIFRHIINSAGEHLEDKKPLIISGLKIMFAETNNKVKQRFAQCIIAMADHNYLELDGGDLMVEFIVQQCALTDENLGRRPTDPEYVTNAALRSMCDNILMLATTTVECMEPVLWPLLLEYLIPVQYTDAFGQLCKSIAHTANKKYEQKAEDYAIDFEVQANIGKPPALITRLLVMAGCPLNGRNRGVHVLAAMQALTPILHPELVELWATVIPKLLHYLEDNAMSDDKWSHKNWEDLLLKLVSKSLDEVDSEDWTAELGDVLSQQLNLYYNYDDEKNFAYKFLGVILRKSTKKDLVARLIDVMYASLNQNSQVQREGIAIAMGFIASSHLDTVLSKLETVTKAEVPKKSSGLLSFMKDKSDGTSENVKATLMLCYGYVTFYAPPSIIVSRLESTILRIIQPYLTNVKDGSVKQNLIRALELIGRTLHHNHLKQPYSFTKRKELVDHLQEYIAAESKKHLASSTRSLALSACATLVKLDPIMSEADMFDLIKTATDHVFPLPPEAVPGKKMESYEEEMEHEVLLEKTVEALCNLLQEFLLKSVRPENVENIFKHLYPWYLSLNAHERKRAVVSTKSVLDCYSDHLKLGSGAANRFSCAGMILGRLVPRCTDPELDVRQTAIDCAQIILKTIYQYEGHQRDEKDPMIEAISTLKERLNRGDSNILFSVVNDLSKVLVKKIPNDQVVLFLDSLMDGLLDAQSHGSSGACVVMNSIMKVRGNELYRNVDTLVDTLHEKLASIEFAQTRTGTLRSVRILATHQLLPVMQTLLNYPLPWDQNAKDCWQSIGQDPNLVQNIIDQMVDILQRALPYEERTDTRDKKTTVKNAMVQPLAISCALHEMYQCDETDELVRKNFPRLFAAHLVLVGSMIGVKPPKLKDEKKDSKSKDKDKKSNKSTKHEPIVPSKMVVESFHQFLIRAKSDVILQLFEQEGSWADFEDEEMFTEACALVARGIASGESKNMSNIVAKLNVSVSSPYEAQRAAVVAFFAELINQKCSGDMTLVELLMNNLLGRLVDQDHRVRMLCTRGLGNVASVGSDQVQKFATTVLSAMMAGMDDKEDPEDDITLEAMNGLSKILAELDESQIRPILINVALRIRPCFEKDRESVRAAAFALFGNLSPFGTGPSQVPFVEQIHTNLVSLLMHLNDPDDEVKKVCKQALKKLGCLMSSESMNSMFQKFLIDEGHLHYGEFMNDLTKTIIQDFQDKINFYTMGAVSFFKSIKPEIRANAVMFIGFLLGNFPREHYSSISKEHVCGALIMLLKDEDPDVRCKAAEAMSLLYDV